MNEDSLATLGRLITEHKAVKKKVNIFRVPVAGGYSELIAMPLTLAYTT